MELDDGLHAGDSPLGVTSLKLEPDQIQADPKCEIKNESMKVFLTTSYGRFPLPTPSPCSRT